MIVLLMSQVAIALATSKWMWISGMVLCSCGVSGYSGSKYVLHLDMVGDKHMDYILTFGTAVSTSKSKTEPFA